MKKILFVCLAGCFLVNIAACGEDELVADTPAKKAALHQAKCLGKSPTQQQLNEASKIYEELYDTVSKPCESKVDDVLICMSKLECSKFNNSNQECAVEINAQAACEVANGNQ